MDHCAYLPDGPRSKRSSCAYLFKYSHFVHCLISAAKVTERIRLLLSFSCKLSVCVVGCCGKLDPTTSRGRTSFDPQQTEH